MAQGDVLTGRQRAQISKMCRQANYLLGIHSDGADPQKVRRELELFKRQAGALLRTRDARPQATA